jgi:hypothetical protein
VKRSKSIKTRKIQAKKSGKDDVDSIWSQARLAQAKQWLDQMWHGLLLAHDPADPTLLDIDAPALCIDGIVFWDEHHRKESDNSSDSSDSDSDNDSDEEI